MCPSPCSRQGSQAGTIAIVSTLSSPTAASSLLKEPQSPQPPRLACSWGRNPSPTRLRGTTHPSTLPGSCRKKKSKTSEGPGIGKTHFFFWSEVSWQAASPKSPTFSSMFSLMKKLPASQGRCVTTSPSGAARSPHGALPRPQHSPSLRSLCRMPLR